MSSTTQRQNAAKLKREKAKAATSVQKKHIPVSAEGLTTLQEEYDQLTKVKRKEISGVVQRAREEGDLRENAGYHAAREEQGMVEARIRELEYLIKNAVVTENFVEDQTVIRVGSIVTLELDGEDVTYSIVGAVEAQPRMGRISNESPVGRALLGHRVGDDFEIATPSASLRAIVKDVHGAVHGVSR